MLSSVTTYQFIDTAVSIQLECTQRSFHLALYRALLRCIMMCFTAFVTNELHY